MRVFNGHNIFSDHQELIWYYKTAKEIQLPDDEWAGLYFKKHVRLAIELLNLSGCILELAKESIDRVKEACKKKSEEWDLGKVVWCRMRELSDEKVRKLQEEAENPTEEDMERMWKYVSQIENTKLKQLFMNQLGTSDFGKRISTEGTI